MPGTLTTRLFPPRVNPGSRVMRLYLTGLILFTCFFKSGNLYRQHIPSICNPSLFPVASDGKTCSLFSHRHKLNYDKLSWKDENAFVICFSYNKTRPYPYSCFILSAVKWFYDSDFVRIPLILATRRCLSVARARGLAAIQNIILQGR